MDLSVIATSVIYFCGIVNIYSSVFLLHYSKDVVQLLLMLKSFGCKYKKAVFVLDVEYSSQRDYY